MPLGKPELDKLFCLYGKKYRIRKLILKAVGIVESSLDARAYRYEPGFWARYLRDHPGWKDKDPSVVSASYGIMQLMWTTAWGLGFRGTQEDLWNPVINIELGAKLIRQLIDRVWKEELPWKHENLSAYDIALARYNGGRRGNPDEKGNLRNQKYVNRVWREWATLLKKEKECDDD